MEKEVDEHLTEKLDKDFASLLQSKVFLSLSQSNVANITNQFQTKVLTEGNSVSNEKSVVKVLDIHNFFDGLFDVCLNFMYS